MKTNCQECGVKIDTESGEYYGLLLCRVCFVKGFQETLSGKKTIGAWSWPKDGVISGISKDITRQKRNAKREGKDSFTLNYSITYFLKDNIFWLEWGGLIRIS